VDFAPRNWLLSWFTGGLNFQIEHHLFTQICHVHYPALAPLVQQTCREFGLRYTANPTFRAGVASHFRWLRRMGQSAALEASSSPCSSVAETTADLLASAGQSRERRLEYAAQDALSSPHPA